MLYYEFSGSMGFTFDTLNDNCFAFEKCYTYKCNNTTTITIINNNES